jgi:hypothetical protein
MSNLPITATALLALALAGSACTISIPAQPTSKSAADSPAKSDSDKSPKSDSAASTPGKSSETAKAKVPEAPKTLAPEAEEKPAKAEAVPTSKRRRPAAPDSWTLIQNRDFGIQFKVPSHWYAGSQAQNGSEVFVAAAPDDTLAICVAAFENPDIGDEEILSTVIDSLGFRPDGEYERVDDGLIYAHGWGNDGEQDVYFRAMVYAYDDVNYVAYLVTPEAQADKNDGTMLQILESFELI